MFRPYARSRTDRAELQREIRSLMGTSREGAQSTRTILRAVAKMDRLVDYATGGELRLALRTRGGESVTFHDAIADAEPSPML